MSARTKPAISAKTAGLAVFFALLAGVAGTFALAAPNFATPGNMLMLLKHMSVTAIVGLGLTFVIAVGFADMSFHFVSCFTGMTMSYLIARGMPAAPAVALGCAAGLVFGLTSGVLVGRFKLPDMVTTIGLGTIAWGMAYFYSEGSYIFTNFQTSGITLLSDSRPAGVPLPVIIMAAAYVGGWLVLHRSAHGRRFYAIGSNPVAARFSGVRVERYVTAAFIICAVLASLTNMIQIAAQGNGNVKGGLSLLMPAYATVFVGVSLFKKPTVIGTLLGALLIAVVQNGFTLMGREFYYMEFVVGMVLVAAIVISGTDLRRLLPRRARQAARPDGENAQ